MGKEKESVLAGFKAFLMRGNVIDLAVAVVIGAAFTNIVNAVVKGVINPVVGAFGTQDLEKYHSCLQGPCVTDKAGVTHGIQLMWGTVLSSALNFLITAAVVYFLMILPMSRFLARRARIMAAKEETPVDEVVVEASELDVLKEIRDSLVSQRTPAPSENGSSVPKSR
ncbi:large conductance mechanosensitive channel protein MscL [Streptomyces sp. 8L]|uniref:large conductance mechanosensitive channel protein MscL n=1 Tax=unclassified Streptomyces TaxID=2593676 RepID=UPI001CD1F8D9|nr:large conductance mechanosensitive channel protein MscL [Streptomyces sp. 8L]MCA1219001.1 large conductance mechanosensitive channel protein MscL [Streptomyces sp. 8L]